MQDLAYLASFLLSSMGLTILVVWPESGPGAWVREQVLRPALPSTARGALDCYICLSFFSGLALSPMWWFFCRAFWCWAGCLMTPCVFWLVLRPTGSALEASEEDSDG